jgi:hypothetical protein
LSDPVFDLAEKWLSVPTEDQDPATTFAKAFKSERERTVELERLVAETNKRLNAKTHELERAVASQGVPVKQVRQPPALQVFCSNPTCETRPLTIAVAPPDEAVPLWIAGYGWRSDEDGQHWCPKEGK